MRAFVAAKVFDTAGELVAGGTGPCYKPKHHDAELFPKARRLPAGFFHFRIGCSISLLN